MRAATVILLPHVHAQGKEGTAQEKKPPIPSFFNSCNNCELFATRGTGGSHYSVSDDASFPA